MFVSSQNTFSHPLLRGNLFKQKSWIIFLQTTSLILNILLYKSDEEVTKFTTDWEHQPWIYDFTKTRFGARQVSWNANLKLHNHWQAMNPECKIHWALEYIPSIAWQIW